MDLNVFTYGTLMDPQVMRAVTARKFPRQPAVLPGFARYRIRGEVYPGLAPVEGAATTGILYRGLARGAIRKLDAFEGSLYQRIPVAVRLSSGERVDALTYVVVPSSRYRLSEQDWTLDELSPRQMRQFMGHYAGFRRAAQRRLAAGKRSDRFRTDLAPHP
ncbi:MAG: gamma-glutamylcyclotransferase family protein [Gammaproteobacteria bacterium]|nr:gamma-glutamylcyclotransferase family protein [Gammaproteobacteria bacterium]